MSQIWKSEGGSSLPDIETLTGNTGGAVGPDGAFNIDLLAEQSSSNNDDGITVTGTPLTNTLTIQLTNRTTAQITTNDDTLQTLLSFPLGATPGMYTVVGEITAYDTTLIAGGSYPFQFSVRTDGVTGTDIGSQFNNIFEDPSMEDTTITIDVSGNNLVISIEGIAGSTINWDVLINYRFRT
jgi:hypothetical protein